MNTINQISNLQHKKEFYVCKLIIVILLSYLITFENVCKASAEVDEEEKALARKVEAEVQRRRVEQARAVQQEEAIGRRRGGRVFLDSMHNTSALNV
jgi:high-affinity K+ transport system ATPase subunit B